MQKGRGAAERDPATINKKPRVVIRGPPAVTKKRDKKARGHCPAHPVRYPLAFYRGPWSVVQKKRGGARGDRVSENEARRGVQSDRAAARRPSQTGVKSMFLTNIWQIETYLCDKSHKKRKRDPWDPQNVTKFLKTVTK